MYGGGCGGGYEVLHDSSSYGGPAADVGAIMMTLFFIGCFATLLFEAPNWLCCALPLAWFLWFGYERERRMTPEEKEKEDEFFRKMEEGREFYPNQW